MVTHRNLSITRGDLATHAEKTDLLAASPALGLVWPH